MQQGLLLRPEINDRAVKGEKKKVGKESSLCLLTHKNIISLKGNGIIKFYCISLDLFKTFFPIHIFVVPDGSLCEK